MTISVDDGHAQFVSEPRPQTRYARSGDIHIAYQVFGEGSEDLVLVRGYATHMDLSWEWPGFRRIMDRLSRIRRVILFDKRGTGLSDPVDEVPTLEQRMDDVRAVMEAAGSERAAIFGFSEGAAMSMLFAATYPDRITHLILWSSMARTTWAPDYPWVPPKEDLLESSRELLRPAWGEGTSIEIWMPSLADDPQAVERWGRFERQAASPGMLVKLIQMFLDIDVRHVLPVIRIPTLVLHRHGDRAVNVYNGRYVAEHIPGARFVEFKGIDHALEAGNTDAVLDEVEEFLTGIAPIPEADRILATILFTDIVGSTTQLARLGDKSWREKLDQHDALVAREIDHHRGRRVNVTGDGVLATFDGPARGVRCAKAICHAALSLGMEVRAGLHTGEIEVRGDDIAGIAVHIGQRVSSLAGPGEVTVSRTVTDLVAGSELRFEDRGKHQLKGVPGAWEIYALKG